MAIQMRRGPFDKFDETKLVEGEVAIVMEGDPSVKDGKSVYIKFPDKAKRMATYEDTIDIVDDLAEDIHASYDESITTAINNINTVSSAIQARENTRIANEEKRASAESDRMANEDIRIANENARKANETTRRTNEEKRLDQEAERVANENTRKLNEGYREQTETSRSLAEESRVIAEQAREEAEARRRADFAQMEQRSQGWLTHICTDAEINYEYNSPKILDPDPGTIYLVPYTDSVLGDGYLEWIVLNDSWERLGTTQVSFDPMTTEQIDQVTSGGGLEGLGSQVVTAEGLNYYWSKELNAFALISHTHALATTETSGFMSMADKSKLDGLNSADFAAKSHTHVHQNILSVSGSAINDKTISLKKLDDNLQNRLTKIEDDIKSNSDNWDSLSQQKIEGLVSNVTGYITGDLLTVIVRNFQGGAGNQLTDVLKSPRKPAIYAAQTVAPQDGSYAYIEVNLDGTVKVRTNSAASIYGTITVPLTG